MYCCVMFPFMACEMHGLWRCRVVVAHILSVGTVIYAVFLSPLSIPGFLPNYLLPDYDEVVNRPPTPPPPYSALHTGPSSVVSSPLAPEQQEGHCLTIQPTPVPPVSESLCSRPSLEEPDNKPVQTAQDSSVILMSDMLQGGPARDGLSSLEKRCEDEEDSCKDPLLKDLGLSDGCTEDKDRLPNGRRRRFTGDSGIEVCVCGTHGSTVCSGAGGTGQEGKELRELQSLLGREEDEENDDGNTGDFCDSCGHPASFSVEDEQAPGGLARRATRGSPGAPQPAQQTGSASSLHPPVCLLLHTISEHEGPHHSTSTEPQG